MKTWRMIAALAGMGLMLGIPALGAEPGRPGTVNYVEGSAYFDGNQLTDSRVGSVAMNAGDTLTTHEGKAEVLLTPGIFLRLDSDSTVRMISPDLAMTKVELDRGRVAIEVDQIFKENNVQVIDRGVTTQLVKTGYYEFDANQPEVLVFKGRAEVLEGGDHWKAVKGHHEMALVSNARGRSQDFNANGAGDQLYAWSSLRSQYLAEANNQIAGQYAYAPGFYPGWYWDPYAWDYTYLGWSPFLSPFGWGFYPWGGWGGWDGWNFYGHPVFGHGFHGSGFRGGRYPGHDSQPAPGRGFRGNPMPGGGFHGGFDGSVGGGFHGGGGFNGRR